MSNEYVVFMFVWDVGDAGMQHECFQHLSDALRAHTAHEKAGYFVGAISTVRLALPNYPEPSRA